MLLKKNIFLLSHSLNSSTPAYGGGKSIQRTSLETPNHPSRSEEWTFKNHIGTHLDFPLHFIDNGKSLSDYTVQDLFFKKTLLIDCPAVEDQILTKENFEKLPIVDCELLILRTGFEKHRGNETYWKNNPGLHPNTATYLKSRYINLRAIGFDFISLTSYQNRPLGRDAHKAYLGAPREMLIIEDMHLSTCTLNKFSTLLSPLLIEKADGSPVNVYGINQTWD